jgi:hypothetical protein
MFQRVGGSRARHRGEHELVRVPHCGKPSALFGTGGGERLAKVVELPLLGQVPLYPRVMEGGDTGRPIVASDPHRRQRRRWRRSPRRCVQQRRPSRRLIASCPTPAPRQLASARAARGAGNGCGHERVRVAHLVNDPLPQTIARVALPRWRRRC